MRKRKIDYGRAGPPDLKRFMDFSQPRKGRRTCDYCLPAIFPKWRRRKAKMPRFALLRLPNGLYICRKHEDRAKADLRVKNA